MIPSPSSGLFLAETEGYGFYFKVDDFNLKSIRIGEIVKKLYNFKNGYIL